MLRAPRPAGRVPCLLLAVSLSVPCGIDPALALEGAADTGRVETADGLHTVVFETDGGRISVQLPDDASAGDTLSGVVTAEPRRGSDAARAQDELFGYVVEVERQKTSAHQPSGVWQIPADARAIDVVLRDRDGRTSAQVAIPVFPLKPTVASPNAAFQIPDVGQVGVPVQVRGPFTGRLSTTHVAVAGQAARVLAESPRKAVLQEPDGVLGASTLEVSANGRKARASHRVVRLAVEVGADLAIAVEGLSGLTRPLQLAVENPTSGVAVLARGNAQTVAVRPQDVSREGRAVVRRPLPTAQTPGSVRASVRPDFVSVPASAGATEGRHGGSGTGVLIGVLAAGGAGAAVYAVRHKEGGSSVAEDILFLGSTPPPGQKVYVANRQTIAAQFSVTLGRSVSGAYLHVATVTDGRSGEQCLAQNSGSVSFETGRAQSLTVVLSAGDWAKGCPLPLTTTGLAVSVVSGSGENLLSRTVSAGYSFSY